MPKNKRLHIFSQAEIFAFYGIPDFNSQQRKEFFSFTENELVLIKNNQQEHINLYCSLQLAYFKAKKIFFQLSWEEIDKLDLEFVTHHYFDNKQITKKYITKHQHYCQRNMIVYFFGYKPWNTTFLPLLLEEAKQIIKRDLNPNFIARELIIFLQNNKIVRPGLTTLQDIVSQSMNSERVRINKALLGELNDEHKLIIENLISSDDTLSKLSALRQDAKNFKFKMMTKERQKLTILDPIYQIAQDILPKLQISNQNIENYAQLSHYYSIKKLRELKFNQSYLYLLCYAFKRYRQITDNLIGAFSFHWKRIDGETRAKAKHCFNEAQVDSERKIGKLLALYVSKKLTNDKTLFSKVLEKAYKIMPKEQIQDLVENLLNKGRRKKEFYWQAIDRSHNTYKKHLRPLLSKLTFESLKNNPWLQSINLLQTTFRNNQKLSDRPFSEVPESTIPKNMKNFLLESNDKNNEKINAARYECFIYNQIGKQLDNGSLYIEDSISHRCFEHELVTTSQQEAILDTLDIPWLNESIVTQLDILTKELNQQWKSFNQALKTGTLKYLQYDTEKKKIITKKIYDNNYEKLKHNFYSQLGMHDISDVLQFVDDKCNFLGDFTPLQPRYVKQGPEKPRLIASLMSQAFCHGNYQMAESSDISYDALEFTCQQYLRLSTLQNANDTITNSIAKLPIYPYFALDLDLIYSSVDGQRFGVATPNVKARHSKKYYNKGQGVSAYTLLANHIPLQCQIIDDHESYYVFDIWYNNTSEIIPDVITGDMHSRNKANFAILSWFGVQLQPRFTNLSAELKKIYVTG